MTVSESESDRMLVKLRDRVHTLVETKMSYNQLGKITGIDRRKLKQLASEGEDVPLRVSELVKLDRCLTENGLGRLLAADAIVNSIAEHGRITFVLGSRPRPAKEVRRIDLSRWDIRSLSEILKGLNRTGRTLQLAIEDVIYRESGQAKRDFGIEGKIQENEIWYHNHLMQQRSIISIGSPIANHCTELLLSKMFDVKPFAPWPSHLEPPFFFAWPDSNVPAAQNESAFKRRPDQLGAMKGVKPSLVKELQKKDASKGDVCVLYDGSLRIVDRRKRWNSYGIVAVQRRAGNQIFAVLAGITGPATVAASRLMVDLFDDLRINEKRQCSKTVWVTIEAEVEDIKKGDERSDERRVLAQSIVGPMKYWPPS